MHPCNQEAPCKTCWTFWRSGNLDNTSWAAIATSLSMTVKPVAPKAPKAIKTNQFSMVPQVVKSTRSRKTASSGLPWSLRRWQQLLLAYAAPRGRMMPWQNWSRQMPKSNQKSDHKFCAWTVAQLPCAWDVVWSRRPWNENQLSNTAIQILL